MQTIPKDARALIEDFVDRFAHGKMNRASARCDLGLSLRRAGHWDLADFDWLDSVLTLNSSLRSCWRQYMDGLHPVTLYMYPANELVRIGPPPTHRDWARRWVDAGGHTFDGRMIALKDDPIWCAISDFQLPFPPFAVGSGMGVRDVDRDTAEKLGVVARHQRVSPKEVRRPSLIMLEQTREEA